jgi:ABC-type transport system involved in multi-copper enzyme maturation permease subunit
MNPLLGAELFKIRKRMMTWILLAVLVVFVILNFILSYLAVTSNHGIGSDVRTSLENALQFPKAFTFAFSVTQSVGIILLIILAASLIGNEYAWGTVNRVISREGRRSLYMGSKLVALITTTLILVLIGLALGTLLGIFTTSRLAGTVDWSFFTLSFAGHLIKMFGWTAFTIMVYALLAVLLASWARSVIAGIGGALGYYFIESILIGVLNDASGWLHRIPDYLIGHNARALVTAVERGGPFSSSTPPPTALHATGVLMIYSLAFLGIIFYLFRRQDLTA